MDTVKKVVGVILPLLVIVTVVNDGGWYLRTMYELSVTSQNAADASATTARSNQDRNASWKAGEDVAREGGADVYGYDLTPERVHLWTRQEVKNTWVLPTIHRVLASEPATAPLVVDDESTSIIR